MHPTAEGKEFWSKYCITKEELIELFSKEGYDQTVANIVDQIRPHFPFMKYSMTDEEMDRMFANIKNYKADLVLNQYYTIGNIPLTSNQLVYKGPLPTPREKSFAKFAGTPVIIKNVHGDYLLYNKIVEFFSEHIRLRARRFNQLENILTWYRNHTKKIVKHCIKEYQQVTSIDIRESVYRLHFECSEFRVTHLCAIIDLWKSQRILDFSAGRGARLMAALSREEHIVQYVGIDPDPEVHESYNQMVQRYAVDNSKYTFIEAPFEEIGIKQLRKVAHGGSFDLVFTSPPYYNLEIYNNDSTQSTERYPDLKSWLEKFMLPSISKAWSLLAPGGRLALVINDPAKSIYPADQYPRYTRHCVAAGHKLPNAVYEGVIAYSGFDIKKARQNTSQQMIPRSPQPIWIWRKET